jgi:four helix bundle protein
MARMQDYRKLVVWERSHRYVLSIYNITNKFPEQERYGLTNQIHRAAVSIPANIAEGCGRGSNAELKRYLYISMGSGSEVDYYLLLVRDLKWIEDAEYQQLSSELDSIRRMLNAFIQKLKTNN